MAASLATFARRLYSGRRCPSTLLSSRFWGTWGPILIIGSCGRGGWDVCAQTVGVVWELFGAEVGKIEGFVCRCWSARALDYEV